MPSTPISSAAITSAASELTGCRVLVVGADGFVGRWVARALTEMGAELHASVLETARAERVFADYGVRARVHRTDLTDDHEREQLLAEVQPAVTFNLAGYGVARQERDEALARAVNQELPAQLALDVARHRDPNWTHTALVHVGSALEYGEVGGDLSEDGPANPTTLYGRTKRRGTEALVETCQAQRLRGVAARLFMLYGPGEHAGRLLPSLLEAARADADLPLSEGLQRRDFTYVGEAAEGLLRLALGNPPAGGVCNLATGLLTPVREFVQAAAEVLGLSPERLHFGDVPTRVEEMEHDPVNVERLEACTAWRPTISPRDGVRATVRFLDAGSPPE